MRIACEKEIGRQRYRLYKEQEAIGQAEISGGQLTGLEVAADWRGRGYGSYLLKEVLRANGGFDTAAETCFTTALPDPDNRPAWALAKRFGFVRQGDRLCRHHLPDLTAVRLVQNLLASLLQPGGLYIDATCGNGHDTLFLCGLAGPQGHVLGLDIQPMAVQATNTLLAQNGMEHVGQAILADHRELLRFAAAGSADCVMFNFGWLPGAPPRGTQPGRGIAGGGAGGAGSPETRRGTERCAVQRQGHRPERKDRGAGLSGTPAADPIHGAGLPLCQLGGHRPAALPGDQAACHLLTGSSIFRLYHGVAGK